MRYMFHTTKSTKPSPFSLPTNYMYRKPTQKQMEERKNIHKGWLLSLQNHLNSTASTVVQPTL